ncbi:hypothetical protein AMTR_s01500p00007820 [Amborella trichopoda]|uniref:Uncharacterized protein n=1 Tax=Amborella trichopoda TaxID=13333 RepID=W1NQZ3_AMBTC|nr:hypothetical protein AMTR_s01500p00007820 [Amborella trichopoda]
MGWFGFVFKPTILEFSEELALGLTTGFLGSLTHLQRLDPENAHFNNPGAMGVWSCGPSIRQFMDAIWFGIATGKKLGQFMDHEGHYKTSCFDGKCWVKSCRDKMVAFGIGKKTEHYQTVIEVLQLGFLGCMSTVSTFVAEFYSLVESGHVWRAFGYSIFSIGLSFALGTLVYSVAVWTKGHAFTDGSNDNVPDHPNFGSPLTDCGCLFPHAWDCILIVNNAKLWSIGSSQPIEMMRDDEESGVDSRGRSPLYCSTTVQFVLRSCHHGFSRGH